MTDKIRSNPFNRPPRIQDVFEPAEIDIPAPPSKQDDKNQNLLQMILPMVSFMVMGLFYSVMFAGSSAGGISGWLYALPMVAMGVFTFITSFVIYGEQKYDQKQRWIKQLRDYHRLLDKKEARLVAGRNLQLDLLVRRFPSTRDLLQRVRNWEITIWERRPEDPDFLVYRLGLGDVPSLVKVKAPDPDADSTEIRRAFGIYSEYRSIPNAPVSINLKNIGSLAFVGRRNHTLPLLRAILAQVAVLNSPEDVRIFLFSSELFYRIWRWLRWLPHTSENQVGGQPTFLSFGKESNREMITAISKILDRRKPEEDSKTTTTVGGPTIFVLFDNETGVRDEPTFSSLMRQGTDFNTISILLCNTLEEVPSDCQSIIEVASDFHFQFAKVGPDGIKLDGLQDKVSQVQMDNLVHKVIPLMVRTLGQNSRIPTNVNLLQVYQENRIDALGISQRWKKIPRNNGLLPFEVPVGGETFSTPQLIDLAENRHGPHGIIAGTTGSGKSELLQTLVCSLALEHHPYFVSFLLVDFKGESTFGIFKDLPHVVGMVSNLDKASASRALEAIKAELVRRQQFLKEQKGEIESINKYHTKLNRDGFLAPDWEPLPHLFIIVDEFAQLTEQMPGFINEIISIGQIGRSLGVHLILSTQRPAGVINDQMRANLNFRISLRVQTVDDSRDMLRRPDAAYLPHDLPGRAYFQVGDGGTPHQFQTARVNVEYDQSSEVLDGKEDLLYRVDFEQRRLLFKPAQSEEKNKHTIARDLVNLITATYEIECDTNHYKKLDPILLPPLPRMIHVLPPLTINDTNDENSIDQDDESLKETFIMDEEKLAWREDRSDWITYSVNDGFKVPVGIIDDLSSRSQPPLWINFLEYGGHLMVVGGPKSGKTKFMETIICTIALRYTPAQANIYVLSFAGRELEYLEKIPHVGAVIQGTEVERFHRLIRLMQSQIEYRKQKFGEVRAQDLYHYNKVVPNESDRLPFLLLLIENFGELRNPNLLDELDDIKKLIQTGRTYGFHLVITALQGNDVPYEIANLIIQRLALNLTDHMEYMQLVGRPEFLDFDVLPPGRCFKADTPPLLCQLAYPPDAKKWEEVTEKMNQAWQGKPYPQEVNILPSRVYLSDLMEDASIKGSGSERIMKTILGLDGDSLSTSWLHWDIDGPHFLVGGPTQSGRTGVLHTAVLELANRYSPSDMWIILVDGTRRSLSPLTRLPHVIDWVTEETGFAKNIANFQAELAHRRQWVEENKNSDDVFGVSGTLPFPDIVFIIDDYDLTSDAWALNESILMTLGRHIRQDSELGFHFVVSAISNFLGSGSDYLIRAIKLVRSGISLHDVDTLEALGGRPTSAMSKEELKEGRGYTIARSQIRLVQFAYPDQKAYDLMYEKWKDHPRAVWLRPATDEQVTQVQEESEPSLQPSAASTRRSSKSDSMMDMDKAVEMYIRQQKEQKSKGKGKKI